MKKSTAATLSFSTIILILFTASCSITNSKKYKNLLSEKEINDFVKNEIKTKGKFRWESVSNHLMYSALMRGDSILSINYKITPDGSKLPVYGESNKLPEEWIIKRDEIVQF